MILKINIGIKPKDMWEHIDDAVNKALKCSDIKCGFAEYKCETCGERTKVPFTCKSKFCNRCGRLYTQIPCPSCDSRV